MSYSKLSSPSSSGGESGGPPDSPTTPPPPVPGGIGGGAAVCPALQKRKAGRKKFRETRHPVFRGVRKRDGGKWVCEVREPKKKTRIWLGTYPTPELAARAYDVSALALRGDQAALNFPHSAWVAPRAKSGSARDIRLAAFQATKFDLLSKQSSMTTCVEEEEEEEEEGSRSEEKVLEEDCSYSRGLFLDEEALFNMPGLIDSMAEGMLLTPPALNMGINWDDQVVNDDLDEGLNSLLNFNLW